MRHETPTFDISVGYQFGLAQGLCAHLIINAGLPAGAAVLVVLAAGAAIGLINGVLVAKVKLNSFVATLGVGILVLGLTQWLTKDVTINGPLPAPFTSLGRNALLGVPLPFVYVLVACGAPWLALEYTPWGRECHATGGNERAARLAGVRTERRAVQAFVLAAGLAALSGCLSVMILGASSPTVGLGSLLPAFAGAFLGGTSIRPGRFNALGTLIAVYLVATGITGLQQEGAQPFVQQLFNGAALLIAVTLARLSRRPACRPFACPHDPLSPRQLRDPYPAWAERPPVFYDARLGLWSVTGYDELLAVLRDTQTFSSADAFALRGFPRPRMLVAKDPPEHTRLRKLMQRAFTPTRIAELEPFIEACCHELANGLHHDLTAEYANALPLRVIADPRLRGVRRLLVAPVDRRLPRAGRARGPRRGRGRSRADRPHASSDGAHASPDRGAPRRSARRRRLRAGRPRAGR